MMDHPLIDLVVAVVIFWSGVQWGRWLERRYQRDVHGFDNLGE